MDLGLEDIIASFALQSLNDSYDGCDEVTGARRVMR